MKKILNIRSLFQIILILITKKKELDSFYKVIFGSDDGKIQSLKKELEERKEQLKKSRRGSKKSYRFI